MSYTYEMHLHTRIGSSDSQLSSLDIVEALAEHNYAGAVVTEHYDAYQLRRHTDYATGLHALNMAWAAGYRDLHDLGERHGLQIFCGMEYSVEAPTEEDWSHILLYGDVYSMLEDDAIHPYLTLPELLEVTSRYDIVRIQAHPFRSYGITPGCKPGVDGYEVLNTKNTDEQNAHLFPPSIFTGGSDAHKIEHLGRGGIITEEPINYIVDTLRRGKHKVKGVV